MKLKTRGKLETNPIQQLTHDTTIYHKPISLSSDRETVYSINIINSNGLNCSSNTGLIDRSDFYRFIIDNQCHDNNFTKNCMETYS